jgi:hypothetical protein
VIFLEGLKIKGEWFLQYNNDPWIGPLPNAMEVGGLSRLAQHTETLPSCYIAIGAAGGEVFRKAVGAVIRSSNLLRFRSTLSLSEGNGDHTWLELYSDASDTSGSGTKINHLNQNFSKTNVQVLNIECRLTFKQGA